MLGLLTMLIAGSAASSDIRPLLRHQGFVGPINGRETIKYVGEIQAARQHYQIYAYRGVFRAAVVDHGVNRVIVILNGSRLYGTYDASEPLACKVHKRRVTCNVGVIEFTDRGPPPRVLFDGRPQDIDRGPKR